MFLRLITLIVIMPSLSWAQLSAPNSFAVLKTSKGDIRLKLFNRDSPKTVENFIGLAKGLKQFRDAKTGKKVKDRPFYNGQIFHKVHPDLGIQTGCPWGNGKGWPGYTIADEAKNNLVFDRPYLVAMAKIPGRNKSAGSQFFITTKKATHLNGQYTIFGEVASGHEIV
ncbi:MAG: peptidylprolyl isomerase, partial [Bdellovibrionales bacterium]|nr:peptidylprolyl isomerase [Bdellovibrionales bacterium]